MCDFLLGIMQETSDVVRDIKAYYDVVTIGVHDGDMHADDVLCAAMVMHVFPDVDIIRTRLDSELEICNFVCDIGKKDFVDECESRIGVDHHQSNSELYPDGTPMAACGKLFNVLYKAGCFESLDDDGAEHIIKTLLKPIEAADNGKKYGRPSLLNFVKYFNGAPETRDDDFYDAAEMAKQIFGRVLVEAKTYSSNAKMFEEALAETLASNGEYLFFRKEIPWIEIFFEYDAEVLNSIKFVMFPHNNKGFTVRTIPSEEGGFDQKYRLPKEWYGLDGEALDKASGLTGGVFVHKNGFMGRWETEGEARKAIETAIAKLK